MIDYALRVPSLVPNRWVYLRKWTRYLGKYSWADRTHANRVAAVRVLDPLGSLIKDENYPGIKISIEGLEPVILVSRGISLDDDMSLLDSYLLSLGAEEVKDIKTEWPANCEGEPYRFDRIPFTINDWDELIKMGGKIGDIIPRTINFKC